MRQVIKVTLFLIIWGGGQSVFAQPTPVVQNPPVNTEVLLSDRGVSYQMVVNKKFQSAPRIGFFSVTNVLGEWDSRQMSDLMTQAHLTFEVLPDVNINAGYHLTPNSGINPTIGLMYSYADSKWLAVMNPRIDLSEDNIAEGFALLEFRPSLSGQWSWYSRLQTLYGFNPSQDLHVRSYLNLRLGVTYQEFTFGVGSNIDYYGPDRRNENSVGGFFRVQLY